MTSSTSRIGLVSLIVDDYDSAIDYFTNKLGFTLTEDKPEVSTKSGKPKRWVVIHRAGPNITTSTGILLAQADGEEQKKAVGNQWAGRVGVFLSVDNFDAEYEKMQTAGVEFLGEPRLEYYGKVDVFRDVWGNKWDLIQWT